MRIYLSCLQALARHPIPAYAFWEPYFKRGIEEAGHTWVESPAVDWAEGLAHAAGPALDAWRERTWTRVLDDIAAEHRRRPIDFFLGYLYPGQVDADAVRVVQKLGIPCVNFFCDNVREFAAVPREYRVFDLHWVPEHKAMRLYRDAGLPAVNAPMPTWVDPKHRTCQHPERHPPTFIGSHDIQRDALFARVLELGAEVELRGPGWADLPAAQAAGSPPRRGGVAAVLRNQVTFARSQGAVALARKIGERLAPPPPRSWSFGPHVREAVFGERYVDVTQQSAVTLGVNRYPSYRVPRSRPDTYSRLRDIEAPMLGACYLTEWTEGLDQLYDLGEEIESYRSAEELVEKLAALGADRARRARMRCRAQQRALSQHSVPRSLRTITDRLGLSRP